MINKYHNGFPLEYGVHISKQNANKIYKLLWTHSFEMVLYLPFFLSSHTVTVSSFSHLQTTDK